MQDIIQEIRKSSVCGKYSVYNKVITAVLAIKFIVINIKSN